MITLNQGIVIFVDLLVVVGIIALLITVVEITFRGNTPDK